jgi:hypothetical protein
MKNIFSIDMCFLDGGASCHYYRSVEGLTDVKEIDESINIGYGESVKQPKSGNQNVKSLKLMVKSSQ